MGKEKSAGGEHYGFGQAYTAAVGAAALLILFAILFIYKERKDMGQLRSDLDRLEGQLNSVYENVNLQIGSLVSSINDQLVQSESLVAGYSAEILSVDMKTTEITYRVEAVPKVFSEETKAKFVLSSGEESVSADGIQENGSYKNYPISASIQVLKNEEVIGTFQVPVYGWD